MRKRFIFILILILSFFCIENVKAEELQTISYQSHVQYDGWQNNVKNGELSGTTKRSLRLEAIKITLSSDLVGNVEYQTHVQYDGWQDWVKNGELAGTTGRSLRLEAIKIKLTGEIANDYDVYYRAHVQYDGWQGWVKNGELAGTTGRSLRLEAIEIKLVKKTSIPIIEYSTHLNNEWQNYVSSGTSGTTGQKTSIDSYKIKLTMPDFLTGNIEYQSYVTPTGWAGKITNDGVSGVFGKNIEAIKINLIGNISKEYDIYYRVHVSNIGWMGWTKNGKVAGTIGYFNPIEAIEVKLLIKDSGELKEEANSYKETSNTVSYQSHVQYEGWQEYVKDGATSGTTGKSLRLESLNIKLNTPHQGDILYRTYVARKGWQEYVKNGVASGTTGLGRNIEAIQIKLDGTIQTYFDIYYRVHVSSIGWLDWAKNDEKAGSVGNDTQIEAIQIKLVKKGLNAPGSTTKKYVTGTWKNNNTNYVSYLGTLATGFKYIDGVKYYFNDEGTLMIKNAKKVIDVSSYQHQIDWDTIKKNEDVDSAIVRIGWGMSYTDAPGIDSYFDYNIKKLKELNIPFSVYIYSYAKVDSAAVSEANFVNDMLKKYGIPKSTFVWYDVERAYPRETYEIVVPTFIKRLKSLGYNNVGVYGNLNALDSVNGYLNSSVIKNNPIWVAQYYKKLQYRGDYKGWQFTSSGSVEGVNGNVDISVFK